MGTSVRTSTRTERGVRSPSRKVVMAWGQLLVGVFDVGIEHRGSDVAHAAHEKVAVESIQNSQNEEGVSESSHG
jgi:hypothetical protein